MNNPNSGGWRFGNTSNDALAPISNSGIDPEFLKRVANFGLLADDKKGALDKALEAKPLTGLLEAPGSSGWGGDYGNQQGGQQQGGAMSTSEGGNSMREVSPSGFNVSLDPNAKTAAGFLSGGPLAALVSSLQVQRTAPVYDLMVPGMNGLPSWGAMMSQAAQGNGGVLGDVSYGGGNDNGMGGLGSQLGGYGSQLGNEAGLGLDAGNIGDGFGFGGFGDW